MQPAKVRIETDQAPPSTGFRSQGLIAAGILLTGGQIGAGMPQEGVYRAPSSDLAEAVQLTLGHLEQVTLAAGSSREQVFEVSAFPKVHGEEDRIRQVTEDFLGFGPALFNYHEVLDVADHALLEMDWMAQVGSGRSAQEAAALVRPLGRGADGILIDSGPFWIWNHLTGKGADLGEASENLLDEIRQKLEKQGGSMENLVKLTVFLREFDPYPLFNNATKTAFAEIIPPTRSVLVAPGVTGDAHICVDVMALKDVN